jgi:hypothetical protein
MTKIFRKSKRQRARRAAWIILGDSNGGARPQHSNVPAGRQVLVTVAGRVMVDLLRSVTTIAASASLKTGAPSVECSTQARLTLARSRGGRLAADEFG